MCKSLCYLRGKSGVTFKEVQDVLPFILRHRINLVTRKEVNSFIQDEIIKKIELPI